MTKQLSCYPIYLIRKKVHELCYYCFILFNRCNYSHLAIEMIIHLKIMYIKIFVQQNIRTVYHYIVNLVRQMQPRSSCLPRRAQIRDLDFKGIPQHK